MRTNDRALDELLEQVGDELAAALARRGRTQRSLDESRRSLGRALRGNSINLRTLADLARALGCTVQIRLVDAPGGDSFVPTAPGGLKVDL